MIWSIITVHILLSMNGQFKIGTHNFPWSFYLIFALVTSPKVSRVNSNQESRQFTLCLLEHRMLWAVESTDLPSIFYNLKFCGQNVSADVSSCFLSLKTFSHRWDMEMVSLQYVFCHEFSNGWLTRNIFGKLYTDVFCITLFHLEKQLEQLKEY